MSNKKYPYIGKFDDSPYNTIVLFIAPKTGTCLTNDIMDENNVGDFSNEWNEEKFVEVDIMAMEE